MCEARSNSSPLKQISIYHGGRLVYPGINNDRVTSHGASNTRLISGRRYEHLRIENTTKEYEGIYYCVVENEHGVGYNRSIYLKVLGKFNTLFQIQVFVYFTLMYTIIFV